MAITVYNENAGLFHASSGGKGIAPADVCLSPPPPPAGPLPVPYVNSLSAGDLSEGSKTVTADGSPTALEDKSYVSTSTGDEAGTQGGSVVTHKTKGKGYFTMWSSTLLIEGKGAARHGDPMGQNCASGPASCLAPGSLVKLALFQIFAIGKGPCPPYDHSKRPGIVKAQRDGVRNKPCWECKLVAKGGIAKIVKADGSSYSKSMTDSQYKSGQGNMTPDHQPPLAAAWEAGGCHMPPGQFRVWAQRASTVQPHCRAHSNSQGSKVTAAVNDLKGIVI